MPYLTEHLGTVVLATGALGTAAFGIVEAMKWTRLGRSGFSKIEKTLGSAVMGSLRNAYGTDYLALLAAQYRNGRGKGDLPRSLRQGIRLGLRPDNAAGMAEHVGVVDGEALVAVANALAGGNTLSAEQKAVLGRFELAIDARIDAALALAESIYLGSVRCAAMGVAVGLALIAAVCIAGGLAEAEWVTALIVGIAAVPLAPIAKDVSRALQSAATAIGARK
jgi:hypothetical protein